MPRRGFVPKREVLPDPVYGNTIVTKLINQIMLDGKRGIAQSVCYDAFNMLADKTGKDAMEVFIPVHDIQAAALRVYVFSGETSPVMVERAGTPHCGNGSFQSHVLSLWK